MINLSKNGWKPKRALSEKIISSICLKVIGDASPTFVGDLRVRPQTQPSLANFITLAIALRRSEKSTGFTRCTLKPAAFDVRTSASVP